MSRPKLQLALDNHDLSSSLAAAQKAQLQVDVMEVGTILAVENGINAVHIMKSLFPDHIVLADIRIIKAGGKLAKLAFESGADWVTVMSDASNETIEAVVKELKLHGNKDVQIEINQSFTSEQTEYWRSLGITQLIYHRSNEVVEKEVKWSPEVINELKNLADIGFQLSITGGLSVDEIKLFKDVPVYCFIAGRRIANSSDPFQAAKEYKEEIIRVFG
ncbi:3-keto-L-gulonate-6-phosphate decarboxylase [Virgibacillus halotolerans]|uniref:orotidine 5'-phosphate decarboxylase / HUMPS family protein n=1 Tax=Virgibacillus halotolerans TaxID=1071053 RepID=UPI00195F3D08|nr:orotidine 5'-phosphate decarboxylase / HUMPS family protein [Virgibacillus halotolerans]MBM7599102.1 3-keto-L-gulonate-6-phosphate decarboxylase [Virgibacillus halotolerans]